MSSGTSHRVDDQIYAQVLQSRLIDVFEQRRNLTVDPRYEDRADRNRFAARYLRDSGANRILNLGGGGARHLETALKCPESQVFEIDIAGDCDLKVNLDSLEALPFDNDSFDIACAFDVLEHLENFHLMNEELFRVARDYVLISLPNSAAEIPFAVFRNRPQREPDLNRGTFSAFYGMPLQPPSDRHRWWIYFQDIVRYYYYFSLKNDADLEFWTPATGIKKRLFRWVFGAHLYYTFFCPFVWIKVSKRK